MSLIIPASVFPRVLLLVPFFCSVALSPDLEPRFEKLSNGLRICIVEEHSQPLISVQLWIRGGAALDPPNMPGLCHVAINALLQQARGDAAANPPRLMFSCGTLSDAGFLRANGRKDDLIRSLSALSSALSPQIISTEELALARNAAAAEWGAADPTPDQVKQRTILAAMFEKTTFQNPPTFVGSGLKDLAPESLNDFIVTWFAPANSTLFILGDIETTAALQAARDAFGKIAWREAPHAKEAARPAIERLDYATPLDHICVAWLTAAPFTFDSITARVTRCLLQQALGANPDVASAPCYASHAGSILVWDLQRNWTRPPALPFVFSNLARGMTSETQLNCARRQVRRQELQAGFGFENWANRLAEAEMIGGDVLLAGLGARFAAQVNQSDVQRLIGQLESATRRVTFWPADQAPGSAGGPPLLGSPLRLEKGVPVQISGGEPAWPGRTTTSISATAVRWTNCPLPPSGFVQFRLMIHAGKPMAPRAEWVWSPNFAALDEYGRFLLARGLGSTWAAEPDGWSLRIDGPRDESAAMVELLAGAARSAASSGHPDQIELRAWGDLTDTELASFAKQLAN